VAPLLRPLRLLALAAALLAIGVGSVGAATPRNPDQVALRWGDTYFSDPSDLAAWLADRGASYGVWAERHPAAAELLEWAAAERARQAVPQGAPFRGVPERIRSSVPEPQPMALSLERRHVPLWTIGGIAALLLAGGLGANVLVRRTGRPGLDPVTLAVSGAGLAAGIFLVAFVTAARF
jgi:hypothetical protein